MGALSEQPAALLAWGPRAMLGCKLAYMACIFCCVCERLAPQVAWQIASGKAWQMPLLGMAEQCSA